MPWSRWADLINSHAGSNFRFCNHAQVVNLWILERHASMFLAFLCCLWWCVPSIGSLNIKDSSELTSLQWLKIISHSKLDTSVTHRLTHFLIHLSFIQPSLGISFIISWDSSFVEQGFRTNFDQHMSGRPNPICLQYVVSAVTFSSSWNCYS